MIQLLGVQAWAQAEARWALGHWATRPGVRTTGHCDTARGARGRARGGRGRGPRASALGPQPGRAARLWAVGCALGALSLFLTRFDSVLFLSQFLDIVREPGS